MKKYIKSSKTTDHINSDILDEVLIGVFGDDYNGFTETDFMTIKVLRPSGDQEYKIILNTEYDWEGYLIIDPDQYFVFNDLGEILDVNIDGI
jgi:hypothetical protein